MADPADGIAAQIRGIEQRYGKPIEAWIELVKASSLSKHPDVVAMLKTDHGMTHGAAHRIALLARSAGRARPGSVEAAVDSLYAGKRATLRPIHDLLTATIMTFGPDVQQVPKSRYLSLRRAKQFAMIQPSTLTRVDVGLIFRDVEPAARLETAAGFNALFTHRVRVSRPADVDTELRDWLHLAYGVAG
jgi:predicted component of type VI protein secretion system